MPLLYFPALSLLLVLISMPLCIALAHRWGLYDVPDADRKLHRGHIPFTGGLSLIFGFLASVIAYFTLAAMQDAELFNSTGLIFVYLLEAGALILVLGVFDDLTDLTFQRKFLFQFLAAFFVILGAIRSDIFPKVFSVEQSSVLYNSIGTLVSVLWIVGLTNAVNMIDGMDGLAAGTSMINALAMGGLAIYWGDPVLALILFTLCGALLGFLFFNFNPARVFMGDTGSMFLGFTLGVLGWLLVDSGPMKFTVFLVPIIMLGLPISDTLLAFIRRMIKKQNPFTGDRFHIHHMLKARFGLSTRATVLWLYAVSLFYAGAGLLVAILPEAFGWLIVGLLLLAQGYFFHMLGYVRLVFQTDPGESRIDAPRVKANGTHLPAANGSGKQSSSHPTRRAR